MRSKPAISAMIAYIFSSQNYVIAKIYMDWNLFLTSMKNGKKPAL